jgi:rubrerythrin
MKTSSMLLLFVAVLCVSLEGCSRNTQLKTIDNLKAAYSDESTIAAKYAKFAVKAREEGFAMIAVLFEAASRSESIQAENYRKTLGRFGETAFSPVIGKITVETTEMNLAAAINGETFEINEMNPAFIYTAKKEMAEDAVLSFTWALETEKQHQQFFRQALKAFQDGMEKSLPTKWYVCPRCGSTYNNKTVDSSCDLCRLKLEEYVVRTE